MNELPKATAISDERLAEMLAGLEGWALLPLNAGERLGASFTGVLFNGMTPLDTCLNIVVESASLRFAGEVFNTANIRAIASELQERRRNTLPTSVTAQEWPVQLNWHGMPYPGDGEQQALSLANCLDDYAQAKPLEARLNHAMHGAAKFIRDIVAIRKAEASLPPSRDDAQVGVVKALVWGETSYGTPEVTTVVGVYRIVHAGNGGWAVSIKAESLRDSNGLTNFATLEAAKAAAHADHKQRILSALEPAQQPIDRATVIEPSLLALIERLEKGRDGRAYVSDDMRSAAKALRALTDKEPTNGN